MRWGDLCLVLLFLKHGSRDGRCFNLDQSIGVKQGGHTKECGGRLTAGSMQARREPTPHTGLPKGCCIIRDSTTEELTRARYSWSGAVFRGVSTLALNCSI